jgi:hypothetical protein
MLSRFIVDDIYIKIKRIISDKDLAEETQNKMADKMDMSLDDIIACKFKYF